jgi:hypothetical protein
VAYADEVLADAPLVYWKLDETSGATAADSSGYNRSFTWSGTPGLGTAPLIGSGTAVTLSGDDSAQVGGTSSWVNRTQYSVECWFSSTATASQYLVLHYQSVSSGSWGLQLNRSGTAAGTLTARNYATNVQVTTPTAVNDGVGHHVVMVQDATTLRLYVDGTEVASAASAAANPDWWNVYIGQYHNGSEKFVGTLDEIAYYGGPLSATRVQAHYNAGDTSAPITVAGQAATGTAVALDGTPITPIRINGEPASATATALDGTAYSGAPPIIVAGEPATATAVALDGAPAITITAGTEPRDLSGRSRLRTGIGYVQIDVPVAPEPPTITPAPIPVVVDTLPAPDIAAGVVAPMTPTVLRESEWGRVRITVSHTDVTYFRDKPAQVADYQLLDPYGYGPATLRFPQVTFWELPDFGTGSLSWLTKNAPVRIQRVSNGEPRELKWLGHIDAFDFDESGALVCDCSGELVGRMDKTQRTQRLVRVVNDAGSMARIALSIQNRSYRLKGSAADWGRTGIPLENTGGAMGTNLAFLDYVLANTVDEDLNSWTILPTDDDPEEFDLVQRDTTTVHATAYLGARGVSARLRDDQLEQPTRMFGEGVAPDGARWRGAEYPNLGPEVPPPYPYNDGRTFGAIGLTDADTDTGAGVSVLEDELLGSGLLGLEERSTTWSRRTTEAVEEVQRRAGLPVTGRVDPATWTAVWGDGTDQQRLTQARIFPLAWQTETEKWLYSPNGSRLGRNPAHDRRVPRIERMVSFGEGVSKRRAAKWLRREMRRANGDNWRGTISLTSDVLAGEHTFGQPGTPMSRLDLAAGMNIRVKRFGSATGMLMHIASVQVSGLDGDSPSVELAVDTQFRDAIGLAEMLERDKAARRDPARRWLAQHRRSAMPSDALVGWDREAGAGVVRRTELTGGQWNVIPVVGGQAGEIQRVDLQTRDSATEFICAVFARQVRPGELQARVGDPFAEVTPGDVWQQVPVADWLAGLDQDERRRYEDERRKRDGWIKAEDGSWVPPEFYEGNITRGDNGQWESADNPPSGQELADLIAEEVNRREELTLDRIAAISDLRVGVYVAGTTTQPCGYWPRSKTDANGDPTGHPVTGRWRDDASFSYWTQSLRSPWLYLAVFPLADCTIHGRMYDQLIEGA